MGSSPENGVERTGKVIRNIGLVGALVGAISLIARWQLGEKLLVPGLVTAGVGEGIVIFSRRKQKG